MHQGVLLIYEMNQDLQVILVLCKFGSNQIKNESTIIQKLSIYLILTLKGQSMMGSDWFKKVLWCSDDSCSAMSILLLKESIKSIDI